MLHCPATLYVARHGDATYGPDRQRVMSDDGGWLTEKGRDQVRACAESLGSERIARVFASPTRRAEESAEIAAGILGVDVEVLDGLSEIGVGDYEGRAWGDPDMRAIYQKWVRGDLDARVPGAETGREIVGRFGDALQGIADLFRGEQSLVFTHGGVMSFVIPRRSSNVADDMAYKKYVPNAVPVRVEIGDDGWRVADWPTPAPVDPAAEERSR